MGSSVAFVGCGNSGVSVLVLAPCLPRDDDFVLEGRVLVFVLDGRGLLVAGGFDVAGAVGCGGSWAKIVTVVLVALCENEDDALTLSVGDDAFPLSVADDGEAVLLPLVVGEGETVVRLKVDVDTFPPLQQTTITVSKTKLQKCFIII